jgi:hypothetical protein
VVVGGAGQEGQRDVVRRAAQQDGGQGQRKSKRLR